MAATAEALMDALAGGSDAAGESDAGKGEPGSATDARQGDQPSEVAGSESHQDPGGSQASAAAQGEGAGGDKGSGGPAAAKPTAEQLYQQAMAANRETRAENKTLKQQLQELTAKIESLAKPPAKAEEPAEPDFLADPKGYVDDTRKQIKDLTEKLESKEKQETEAEQQQEQAREAWRKVVATEQEFAAATPDYYDAINHVRAIRAEQIKIEIRETQDREATPEEIGKILTTQEMQGAAALIAKGKNPSKFYYEYAKTYGYKKAESPPALNGAAKPDKDAVRTMGSGGATESAADDDGPSDSPLGGLLAAAQNEHKAQFKRRAK